MVAGDKRAMKEKLQNTLLAPEAFGRAVIYAIMNFTFTRINVLEKMCKYIRVWGWVLISQFGSPTLVDKVMSDKKQGTTGSIYFNEWTFKGFLFFLIDKISPFYYEQVWCKMIGG